MSRIVDGITARVAGEIGYRSSRDTVDPLAKQYGERSGTALVASVGRLPQPAAASLGKVGMGIRARSSLTGEELPSLHPLLGDAVDEGRIPLASARLALVCLDRAERHLSVEKLAALEANLVEKAEAYPISEFSTFSQHAADLIDAEGIEPSEAMQREREGVRSFARPNGMMRTIIDTASENSGFIHAAIQGSMVPRPALVADGEFNDLAMADTRTLPQRRLDALMGVIRAGIAADDSRVAGVDTTMLVAVNLSDLQEGAGAAYILGIDEPISIATTLRLAATARIIPIGLDSKGEILFAGRGSRLFNRAQRRAMALRDGGCVVDGCTAPLSQVQAAHIRSWAAGGPTDLDNGLLLCAFHHRMFDLGGWEYMRQGDKRYLVPPADIDPLRRPRPIRNRRPNLQAILR
nr:HNH endonuclease signature motif containing protein [Naasia lichenicola]